MRAGLTRLQRTFGSVRKMPGAMALTVTRWGAQSAATARVNWITAALLVS